MGRDFQRLQFGGMWLLALAGLGAQYMTTGFLWIGLVLSGLGLLVFVWRFVGDLKRLRVVLVPDEGSQQVYTSPSGELWISLIIIPALVLLTGYVFFFSELPSQVLPNNNQVALEKRPATDNLNDELALRNENARLQRELREAKQNTRDVQAQIDALRGRLSSQRISKRSEFIRALREMGPAMLSMNYISGDRNAVDLFSDLQNLLVAGGWTIKNKASVTGTPWVGVRVAVKDKNAIPPGAALMVELLKQNGIAAGVVEDAENVDLATTTFSLEIGYRP